MLYGRQREVCAGDSPRSKTDRRLTESGANSEAVHSLTSSDGTPPFLFVGFAGQVQRMLFGSIGGWGNSPIINWLLRQDFSTDTRPDALASSDSVCQVRCNGGHTRTHVLIVEKQGSQRRGQIREQGRWEGALSSELWNSSPSSAVDLSFVTERVETMAEPILVTACAAAQQGWRRSFRESGQMLVMRANL